MDALRTIAVGLFWVGTLADLPGQEALPSNVSPENLSKGKIIYQNLCVDCHGQKGEGVAGKSDEPLYGDWSLSKLTRVIERTMPEDHPEACVGEEAAQVAEYAYAAFYSAEARSRLGATPPYRLTHLTARQHLNALSDVFAQFRSPVRPDSRRGLQGKYYNHRSFKSDTKVIDRIDKTIEFQFGDKAPEGAEFGEEGFSVQWRGSLWVEDSGEYTIFLTTENGVRLYLNDNETALIDGWVSSGTEPRTQEVALKLLGGRYYPVKLDYFKYKEASASVVLEWHAPGGVREPIPTRNLVPSSAPEVFVPTTPFPPDDGSLGYERGTNISREWDMASTQAAIEAADYGVEHFKELSSRIGKGLAEKERYRSFAQEVAEIAFRRPLSESEKQRWIDLWFGEETEWETALRRSLLLALKSPQFLYPDLVGTGGDLHRTKGAVYQGAARLALALWDSVPNDSLRKWSRETDLLCASSLREQAREMLDQPAARSKVRSFFHDWLHLEEADELSKDLDEYPGFDGELIEDLRHSLNQFLEEVVWEEPSDYRRLLNSDSLYLNRRLAEFYGVTGDFDEEYEKVSFQHEGRAGILTHPLILSIFSYHKSSSPIHRGVFLTRSVLGRALKPPPMAIEFMDGRFDPHMTMREKVTELTSPANCMGCHSIINPLGFSLETFDAVGRYRSCDQGRPVNTTSDYETLGGEVLRIQSIQDVSQHAVSDLDAQMGFIRQLFQYTVKHPPQAFGLNTLSELHHRFQETQYNVQELLVEIAVISALHPNPSTRD